MTRAKIRERRRRAGALCLSLTLAASACAAGARPAPSPVPAAPADRIDTSLFLIGDAGKPARGGEPVLKALSSEIGRNGSRSFVVFLGDNVYMRGLPAPGHADRAEAERRLDAQMAAVRAVGARALFIPGNHDWDRHGKDGWEAVRRQGRYVTERGGGTITYLPGDGCPGPETLDVGTRLRLVALDTQWWLHGHARPQHPSSSCPTDSEEEVVAGLRTALAAAGDRRVMVVGHHPLASGGPHGGDFGWETHVFPLRELKPWLWVPLPILGSTYPIARQKGISDQDLSGPRNRRMREAFEGAFRERPPLVYASGHEHNLQVFEGRSARHLLVSGAGSYDHLSPTAWRAETRFAASESGFLRVDVVQDGRLRLAVLVVDKNGFAVERYSAWLE